MKKIKELKIKLKEFCYRHPILGWAGWLVLFVVLVIEFITGLTLINSFKATDGDVAEGLETDEDNSDGGSLEE